MIEIEEGSGNVYADLQMPDADAMYVKARLASKIGEIIRYRHLTQQQAAEILGITQPVEMWKSSCARHHAVIQRAIRKLYLSDSKKAKETKRGQIDNWGQIPIKSPISSA